MSSLNCGSVMGLERNTHADVKVSVVVPCYNAERYLDRAVSSICLQDYSCLEIILIDDGSTDSTGSLCDEWANRDDRIMVIHQDNGGLSAARNSGIKAATGSYMCFVDSDDLLEHNFISRLFCEIKRSDSDIAVCGYKKINEEDQLMGSRSFDSQCDMSLEGYIAGLLSDDYCPSAWGKLFRREIFGAVSFKEGILFEDTYLWGDVLECLDDLRIVAISDCLYLYRHTAGSIMRSFHGEREAEMLVAWGHVCGKFAERFPQKVQMAKEKYYHANIEVFDRILLAGADRQTMLYAKTLEYLRSCSRDGFRSSFITTRRKAMLCVLHVSTRLYGHLLRALR